MKIVNMFLMSLILVTGCDNQAVSSEFDEIKSSVNAESVGVIMKSIIKTRKTNLKRMSHWNSDHYSYESYKLNNFSRFPVPPHFGKRREKRVKQLLLTMKDNYYTKMQRYISSLQELNIRYESLKKEVYMSEETIELIQKNQHSIAQLITLAKDNIRG